MKEISNNKLRHLREIIANYGKVVIGFSGGIDSSLLLKVSIDTLGNDRVWAVTGDSESLIPEELEFCRSLGDNLGLNPANFIEIRTNEIDNPDYRKNPINRCYFCKSELFGHLSRIAEEVGADVVFDGSNVDDLNDWRPGRKAAGELGVVSPLAEAGITKEELREMAREFGLPNWDKPAMPCLSSRIPYGQEVTPQKLTRIAGAERYLRSLGFTQVRVRHYEKAAKIELMKNEMPRLSAENLLPGITEKLISLGFSSVTIDPKGFRSGSLNEELVAKGKNE